MSFDLVVVLTDQCTPPELGEFVRQVVEQVSGIESLTLLSFGERAAAYCVAITSSPLLWSVQTHSAYFDTCSWDLDEVAGVLNRGTSSHVIMANLHGVDFDEVLSPTGHFQSGASELRIMSLPRSPSEGMCPMEALVIGYRRSHVSFDGPKALSEVQNFVPWVAESLFASSRLPSTSDRGQSSNQREVHSRYLGAAPVLSVIVPTLDATFPRVRRLLDSLRRYTPVPYQIILVDNGNSPQGFTQPVNTGLRGAVSEYVAIINDDVEVEANWWAPLQDSLDKGAKVVFPHTQEYARLDFSAWCFAMRKTTLQEFAMNAGEFLDSRFSIWFQDSDLFMRLRQAGIAPRYVSTSSIRHGLSETLRSDDPRLREWIHRMVSEDEAAFVEKWGDEGLAVIGFHDPFAVKAGAQGGR